MRVPNYFRKLARRCLVLSKTAVEPEVIEQMRVWAVDFADEAERRDHRARMAHRERRGRAPKRGLSGARHWGSDQPFLVVETGE
jgi:hypothetical protein